MGLPFYCSPGLSAGSRGERSALQGLAEASRDDQGQGALSQAPGAYQV